MKKKTKKFLQVVCGLIFSACLVGCGTVGSAKEEVSPLTVYAVNNVETLSVNYTPEYFNDYGVGETIVINNYETTVNGEKTTLYAVLQKDYEVFAVLTPDMEQVTYEFSETGAYNLIYYTQVGAQKTIVKNIRFTVGEQPYIDIVFDAEYMVNQSISLQAECVFDKKKTTASVSVKSPSGKSVELIDNAAKLAECGKYAVTYVAEMDGVTISRVYYLNVTGSSDSYADYLMNVSGVTDVEGNIQAGEWAVAGAGVRVTGGSFSAFRYANIVDVDTVTKEENLINLLPLGTDGYSTLSKIMIKLIDVYDETNVIAYECRYVKNSDRFTYCKIQYKDILKARRGAGIAGFFENTMYGLGAGGVYFDVERYGFLESEYGNLKWLRLQMDHAEKKFFVTRGNTKAADYQDEILDLDDPTHVGYGNEWSGFTTGEVYIQIELTGKGSQTGCIVQEIAGEKLYGEKTSEKGPSILFAEEENGKMPTGVVGKYYPFPAVQYSIDAMDGKYLYPEYEIVALEKSLFDGLKYTAIELSSVKGFTPEEEGTYRITYKVKDTDGNVGVRHIFFDVKNSLGEKGVAYDQEIPQSVNVGTYITIPKLIPTGLSYLVSSEENIIYNGVDYAKKAGEKVFLSTPGEIKIRCLYEDYLGESYEYENTYTVVASENAITNLEGIIPKYVLKGRSIVLPNLSAINYSKDSASDEYYPTWKLTVDGQEIDTNERSVTVVKNNGETMNVAYSAEGRTLYTATMQVVDAKYLADRFFVTSGSLTTENGSKGVVLTAKTDSTVDFINPLIVDSSVRNLALTLSVQSGIENFEYIDVYFEDYLYSDIQVFVRITSTESGLFAQVNGEGEVLALTPSTKYDGYIMSYDVLLDAFEFSSRLVVKKDTNGKKFNGFPSNRINVRFDVRGVSGETKICVAELGLFGLLSQFDANGTLQQYEDKAIPTIVSEGSFRDNSFVYGTVAYFPAIEARTALSGLTTAKLTVTSPSGKVIIDNQNAYNDYSFTIDEYGSYKVVYSVPFRSTTYKFNYTVRVFKEIFPEISLKTALKESYKVGTTVTIPDVVVSGAGKKLTTKCYIMLPDSSLVSVKVGDKIKLETCGVYKLQVIVMDEYNVTFETWKFKVEG